VCVREIEGGGGGGREKGREGERERGGEGERGGVEREAVGTQRAAQHQSTVRCFSIEKSRPIKSRLRRVYLCPDSDMFRDYIVLTWHTTPGRGPHFRTFRIDAIPPHIRTPDP